MSIDGEGNIVIDCKKLTITASDAVDIKATADFKAEGMNANVKGKTGAKLEGSMVDVKASGVANVKGSMVNIN